VKTVELYTKICKDIVHSCLDGYNGTIFAYGQTTSGKTFTMIGVRDNPGLLPCALHDVFHEKEKRSTWTYNFYVSYLEIYNETVRTPALSRTYRRSTIC
jgi:centromeric protein E